MTDAISIWRDKLRYLQQEEALTVSADQKFRLKQAIQEARSRIEALSAAIPPSEKHIFLSYCHDNRHEAKHLYESLVSAGTRVWWDQALIAGSDWREEIRRAIRNAYAVIACFSKEAESKDRSGMYPELRSAIEEFRTLPPHQTFLLPVKFSDCRVPPIPIDGSRSLADLQAIDLYPDDKWDQGVEQLRHAIEELRESPDASVVTESNESNNVGRLSPLVDVELTLDESFTNADKDRVLEAIEKLLGLTDNITIRTKRRG